MRVKKLVSALSALAITVTAMAGLAVTANAAGAYVSPENLVYSVNYADSEAYATAGATDGWDVWYSQAGEATVGIGVGSGMEGKAALAGSGSNSRAYEAGKIWQKTYAGDVSVVANWNTGECTNIDGGVPIYSFIRLLDSNKRPIMEVRAYGQNVEIGVNNNNAVSGFDKNDVREASWTIVADIDYENKQVDYEIKIGNKTLLTGNDVAFMDSEASALSGVSIGKGGGTRGASKNNPQILKDISVYQFTPPEPVAPAVEQVTVNDESGVAMADVAAFATTTEASVSEGQTLYWNITATKDGQTKHGSEPIEANLETAVKVGLIVYNIPEGAEVTAELGYTPIADAE